MPLDGPARAWSKEQALARGQRRYKRKVASAKTWARLRDEKDGPCRCCSAAPPNQLHHLIPRQQGGDDVADCLVPVCHSCHRLIEERDPIAGLALARSLSDAEYAFMHDVGGEGVLERRLGVEYRRP